MSATVILPLSLGYDVCILALLHWEITLGVKTTNCRGANSYSTKALCCCRLSWRARKENIVKVASSVVEARREREFWEGQQQQGISWDAEVGVRLLIVVRAVEVLG